MVMFLELKSFKLVSVWQALHMEGTWRLGSTSVGLHPYEAAIQKQCEGCADTAWGRY